MKRKILFLVLYTSLIPNVCQSQNQQPDTKNPKASGPLSTEKDVDRYFSETTAISSSTGPFAITRSVLQDSQGGFWLATWNGIVRFDGNRFTNVTNKEGLRRFRAFSLLEDNANQVWIGTTGAGLYKYNGNSYRNYTTADGLVDNTVLSMMQDSKDNLWFGGLGLTKFDGKTFKKFNQEDGFTNSDVNSISESPDGKLWFGTRGALFHYDGQSFVDFTAKHQLKIPSYIPTLIDRNGHLWFGGENGIYHYDGKQIKHIFKSASYSLFEDSKGNIWFSGGMAKEVRSDGPRITFLNRFDPTEGLENLLAKRKRFEIEGGRGVFELMEDSEGNIWFGTGRGVGQIKGENIRYY